MEHSNLTIAQNMKANGVTGKCTEKVCLLSLMAKKLKVNGRTETSLKNNTRTPNIGGQLMKGSVDSGFGTVTYADGSKYEGEWENNKRHGKGTFTYSDGLKYQGQWRNDKKHGKGTLTYSDGSKYQGQWLNDEMHGENILTYSNGNKIKYEWDNGKYKGRKD